MRAIKDARSWSCGGSAGKRQDFAL